MFALCRLIFDHFQGTELVCSDLFKANPKAEFECRTKVGRPPKHKPGR